MVSICHLEFRKAQSSGESDWRVHIYICLQVYVKRWEVILVQKRYSQGLQWESEILWVHGNLLRGTLVMAVGMTCFYNFGSEVIHGNAYGKGKLDCIFGFFGRTIWGEQIVSWPQKGVHTKGCSPVIY